MIVRLASSIAALALLLGWAEGAFATPFTFSTGDPDGRIATATRPSGGGNIEIESADDFIVGPGVATISKAIFTGLLTGGTVGEVRVEIYRVFPGDSTVPPSGNVPTRVNSPSDLAFAERDSAGGTLVFATSTLAASFTASNSVVNGINRAPNQTTGGEGPVTGQEILVSVSFPTPFVLPSDHYFFVPQVQVTDGEFLWLSAPRPIVSPGTPFSPDLQSWIRNDLLAPDWLRIGSDIVGGGPAPAFDASFALAGDLAPVPEPGTLLLLGSTLVGLGIRARRRR